jgi:hypothetical protein
LFKELIKNIVCLPYKNNSHGQISYTEWHYMALWEIE